jgi:hypothetical protein
VRNWVSCLWTASSSCFLDRAKWRPGSGQVPQSRVFTYFLTQVLVGEAGGQGTRTTATRVMFHPATGIASKAVAQAQASLRRRILRAFVGRGLLEGFEAQEMLGYKHSGFSVDSSVRIAAQDRAGLERLLRCCALLCASSVCAGSAAQVGP